MINKLNFPSIEKEYPYIKQLILGIILITYWCFGFYPFNLEMPIGVKTNSASYQAMEGLRFEGQGIGYTMTAPDWLASVIATSILDVTVDFKTKNIKQSGPARILTISEDERNRNLTIAQDGDDLILRIRTPLTNLNGFPPYKIKNIIKENEWHTLRVSITPNKLNILLDGQPTLFSFLPQNSLSVWSPQYRLALGNEFTHNRPWRGSIRHAIIETGEEKIDYAVAENLYLPKHLMFNRASYQLVPFSSTSMTSNRVQDWIVNLLGFIPFGFLIVFISNGSFSLIKAVILCALLSLSVEIGQLFLAGRVTAIDDLILNSLGGLLGVLAGVQLKNQNKIDPP